MKRAVLGRPSVLLHYQASPSAAYSPTTGMAPRLPPPFAARHFRTVGGGAVRHLACGFEGLKRGGRREAAVEAHNHTAHDQTCAACHFFRGSCLLAGGPGSGLGIGRKT